MNNDNEQNIKDETYDVMVNPNGEFLGELVVNYKETGESIPVPLPLEEFRKAIQEEIDAEILEAIRKEVQDANKEKTMNKTNDFIIVREYKTTPPLPEGEIRVSILKRKEFDTTGYSFLRISEVNGFDEWVPTDRLDYYRRVFGLTEEQDNETT